MLIKTLYAPIRYKIMKCILTILIRQINKIIYKYVGKYEITSVKFSKELDHTVVRTNAGVSIALSFNKLGFLENMTCSPIYINGEPKIFFDRNFLMVDEFVNSNLYAAMFIAQNLREEINKIERCCE